MVYALFAHIIICTFFILHVNVFVIELALHCLVIVRVCMLMTQQAWYYYYYFSYYYSYNYPFF